MEEHITADAPLLRTDCSGVDWSAVPALLELVGMAYHAPEKHKMAFENSRAVVFAYQGGRLIGFGRAISDGVCQAALYDVAVVPEWQKKGLGAEMVRGLIARLPGCNVLLYAAPGKEGFYSKLGFRRMLTGMALFRDPERMAARGFIE
jgi:ribosomal protein S18 acetylase RimI-like enzyme